MPACIGPNSFPFAHGECKSLRSLIEHYSKVESTLPHFIDLAASQDNIYDDFQETFSCSQELDFILTFIPDIHAELRGNLKQPRAESTNDTGVVSEEKVVECPLGAVTGRNGQNIYINIGLSRTSLSCVKYEA